MRRLKVAYRPEAIADLDDVFAAILKVSRSPTTAAGYVSRIRARCRKIGDAPRGGRPRDDLATGLRTVPFERVAVIAYRIENELVLITNVFHGGRDYESLYRGIEETE